MGKIKKKWFINFIKNEHEIFIKFPFQLSTNWDIFVYGVLSFYMKMTF